MEQRSAGGASTRALSTRRCKWRVARAHTTRPTAPRSPRDFCALLIRRVTFALIHSRYRPSAVLCISSAF